MKVLTRLIAVTERIVGSIVTPLTLGIAFISRRGRWSGWQRRQRREALERRSRAAMR